MSNINKKFYAYVFIIIFGMLSAATADCQTQEYKEYTITRGDTLWGISSKEVIDPFLWPKIWKENPAIKNPDLIYPGQKIKIPLHLLQKEFVPPPAEEKAMPAPEIKPLVKKAEPEVVKIEPKKIEPVAEVDIMASGGYIAETLDSAGEIVGSPTERTLLGRGDYAYIKTVSPVSKGDRFYIIRSLGKVFHPESGDMIGYLIDVTGVAEVIGKESEMSKVRITASFSEVLVGDLLSNFYEIEEQFIAGNPRTPDVSGFVVAAKQRRILNTKNDIVYIDKGRKDGIEIGDLIRTISSGKYKIPNGVIQILSIRESTATAIVRKCEKEISTGDRISTLVNLQ